MTGAIGYARVSTDEQAKENNSLPAQRKRISSFCEESSLTLLKVFEFSESARTMNRPGLTEMLSYCREQRKGISHVVITALSRLARSVQDQAQIIAILKQLGITVVSLDEPITDDSAMGQLVRNMVGSFNQFFSDSLSEQTRERMRARVREGRFLWPAPIGYVNKNKTLRLDPDRAPFVRQTFELIASGRYVTTNAVLKVITALGLTTRKGRPLSKQTFTRMIINPVYAGWIVSGDLRVRGAHEPIISEELFNTVQNRVNTKGTPHKKLSEEFPLRGIIRCAKCRKRLTAGSVKGRNDYYPKYWCWTVGCRAVTISRDILHEQFVGLLSRMEPTAELLTQLPERVAEHWRERKEKIAKDAARLTKRLAEQKTLNQRAIVAKLKDEISAEEYEAFKKASEEEAFCIEAEITALDSERSTMEEMLKQAEAQAVDLVGAWERGNVNQRQELARAFFPEGLVFSKKKGFFEPANTVITEMLMRFLDDCRNIGVPDGI